MSESILSSLRDLLFKELVNKVRRCGRTSELIDHENGIEDPLLLQVWRFPFRNILDVGCGYGRLSSYAEKFWPTAFLVSLDLSKQAVYWTKSLVGSTVLVADGLNLPFRRGVFDLVICTQVIEHLERDKQGTLLSEFRRVLSPKGFLYLTSIMSKLPIPLAKGHIREFSDVQEFRKVVSKSGFKVMTLMLRPIRFPMRHTFYRILARLGLVDEKPYLIFKMKTALDYFLALPRIGYYSIDALARKNND